MLAVPGAMEAGLTSGVFWASQAFALLAARTHQAGHLVADLRWARRVRAYHHAL